MKIALAPAETIHARRGPQAMAFRYGLQMIWAEMTAPLDPSVRLFSVNRFNLFSYRDDRHGRGEGAALDWARGLWRDEGFGPVLEEGRIFLLTQPRMLGMGFDPVSFWMLIDASGALRAALAEVNNTFGDRHTYLIHHADHRPILPGERIGAVKRMHVSPFQPVAGDYAFRFDLRPEKIAIWIDYAHEGGGLFASLVAWPEPMTDRALMRTALRRPFGFIRTLALIHARALQLVIKGAAYRPRPPKETS